MSYKKKKKKTESVDKNRKGMTDEKAVDEELTGKRISKVIYLLRGVAVCFIPVLQSFISCRCEGGERS